MIAESGYFNNELPPDPSPEEKGRLKESQEEQTPSEDQSETLNETQGEPQPIEPQPEQLEKIETVEQTIEPKNAEDYNTPIDPETLLKNTEHSLADTQEQIKKLTASMKNHRDNLAKIRENLGIEQQNDPLLEEKQLADLKAKEEHLEKEKEEAEKIKDLEDVLLELSKLSKPDLLIVIQTGKAPNGKELESKHGNIKPEAAKKLAEAAEKGERKITKGLLKMISGVFGIIAGIFELIGKAVS